MSKPSPLVDASKAMTVMQQLDDGTGEIVTYERPALDPAAKLVEIERRTAEPAELAPSPDEKIAELEARHAALVEQLVQAGVKIDAEALTASD